MFQFTGEEYRGEPTRIFSINKLHDFVRMLDAPGYPKAFLSYGDFRIEMLNARINDKTLSAEVKVIKHEK